MQCAILAGGLGTRMLPRTETVPKSLIPVRGEPFAGHQLTLLARQGVDRVVFCVGYRGDMLRDFVGDGSRWGVDAAFVDEGGELRGTAGALRLALDADVLDDAFFVLYGDSYLPIAYPPVWDAFASAGLPALMTVFRNEGRWDASNTVYRDGRVVRYEKGCPDPAAAGMAYLDYGLAVLSRGVVEEVPAGEVADLADVYRRLSVAGRLAGYEVYERFYEIGSEAGLRDLDDHLGRGEDSDPPGPT